MQSPALAGDECRPDRIFRRVPTYPAIPGRRPDGSCDQFWHASGTPGMSFRRCPSRPFRRIISLGSELAFREWPAQSIAVQKHRQPEGNASPAAGTPSMFTSSCAASG